MGIVVKSGGLFGNTRHLCGKFGSGNRCPTQANPGEPISLCASDHRRGPHVCRQRLSIRWFKLCLVCISLWSSNLVYSSSDNADAWATYRSGHLTLITNLTPAKARQLIQSVIDFDQVLHHYISAVNADQSATKPAVTLLVFNSRKELRRLLRTNRLAAYAQPYLDEMLLVIAPPPGSRDVLANTLHEYTHYKVRTDSKSYPLWYEEGLAVVLSSAEIERDEGQVRTTVGKHLLTPPNDHAAIDSVRINDLVNTQNYQAWTAADLQKFYLKSAHLVHYFLFAPAVDQPDYRPALDTYFNQRSLGFLPTLDVSQRKLERALSRYLKRRSLPFNTHQHVFEGAEIHSGPISAAAVDRYRAKAALAVSPKRALDYYRRVSEAQPQNPDAWVERASAEFTNRDLAAAQQSVARALAIAPSDPNALIEQARHQTYTCRLSRSPACAKQWLAASQTVRQALEQDPQNLGGIYHLGIIELYTGNPGRAINYLKIVHREAPWSPRLNYHLGECLRLLGNPRAVNYLTNARDWAQLDLYRELANASLKLLHSQ